VGLSVKYLMDLPVFENGSQLLVHHCSLAIAYHILRKSSLFFCVQEASIYPA